ncbi:hypothetical protein [Echinicola vietnamensis]|uniref:Uncharacterized protein n=1 Tax=Echinicola vietnamensis (strain DSM 17526 / LMG 23754 / KMM 6221) TaxID=926556 RepID=L0FXA9_ECHVK|nr:hypothetical protein [Echinicola vietnamensis]AGA77678.1 hypothetical protein Echvi_1410 [Echinicola vietnamensis DSM 17526]
METNKITEVQRDLVKEKAHRTLFYTVFGTILPFIIGAVILIAFTKFKELVTFITDGTFCLFAAGLLTSATFLMNENSDSIRSKWDKRIHKYLQPVWIIVAIVYGAVYAKVNLPINEKINTVFLWIVSIVCFLFSIYALYRALYIEGVQNPPKVDALKNRKTDIDNIMDEIG